MKNYRNTVIADEIVNMTDTTINMYEESTGSIKRFAPVAIDDVDMTEELDTQEKRYVVENTQKMNELIECGIAIGNIAIIDKQPVGRGGNVISYLVSAEAPHDRVLFSDKSFAACF